MALARAKKLGQWIDERYELRASAERPVVSIVTIGEMRSLARQFGWGDDKRKMLGRILEELIVVDIRSEDVLAAYEEPTRRE